jgi:5-methylcytosine-specific restriction endonuclease McrA
MATGPFDITAEEIEQTLAALRLAAQSPKRRARPADVMEMDYNTQYLRTKLWREIKQRVLARDSGICQSCGGKGTYVHHLAYTREVMEGVADHLLATVCVVCHGIMHFNESGGRRDWRRPTRFSATASSEPISRNQT